MKVRYAEVYLNIRTSEIDSAFDYIIPENIQNDVKKGSVVIVPFGKKTLKGIVSRIKNHSSFDSEKIKAVKGVFADYNIGREQIKLAHWMSYYYIGSMGNALRLFMPPGFNFKETKKIPALKKKKIYKLSQFTENPEIYLKSRPSQKKIIEFLENVPQSEKEELLRKTGSNPWSLNQLLKKGYISEQSLTVKKDFSYDDYLLDNDINKDKEIILNSSQLNCLKRITGFIEKPLNHNFLLEGVTGSGKTEVYIRCVEKALEKNRTSVILTPEISLVPQLYSMFRKVFKDNCCVYHSGMSESERYEKWLDILSGKCKVIIGTRSALFTPFKNPGIIIVDEFHDTSYKENSGLRYCTIETALKFCKILEIPIILGSATPSIRIKYRFEKDKNSSILKLEEKIFKDSKVIRGIIDLKKINSFSEDEIITNKLYSEIFERVNKKEKAIIFINKRGYSKYIICSECGFIPKCENCNMSYTYHSVGNKLKCHHCDKEIIFKKICLQCGSKRVMMLGTGIQKVEEKIRKRFPDVSVVRMDSDVTSKKKSHEKILNEFIRSSPSILIGTQMVSKGLDIKDVTLVGVVNIDSMFSLPDYIINERVFQILTQVAGRAGRGFKDGRVIVQTYNSDGMIIRSFMKDNFELFYNDELKMRKNLKYPPYSNLVNIIISGRSYEKISKVSYRLAKDIQKIKNYTECEILGPAPSPFSKINNNYRWHILVKSFDINNFISRFTKMFNEFKIEKTARVLIDVDPYWIL
jgi:primosomal protein N' (replication factor Y)